jgi:hypothetical protein
MLSKVAIVVMRHKCFPTLAIRSQYREGAGKFLPEVGQRAIFLAKRPDYRRCGPVFAVVRDSLGSAQQSAWDVERSVA